MLDALLEYYKSQKELKRISNNQNNKLQRNHEIWRVCDNCGHEYDARVWGIKCPKCE